MEGGNETPASFTPLAELSPVKFQVVILTDHFSLHGRKWKGGINASWRVREFFFWCTPWAR